jgi:hypothetical protein
MEGRRPVDLFTINEYFAVIPSSIPPQSSAIGLLERQRNSGIKKGFPSKQQILFIPLLLCLDCPKPG